MTRFRSRSDGSHYPVHGRSLFNYPPRSSQLAKEISIKNGSQARDSVSHLNTQFENAGSRARRVQLIQAANQAANRAKVISKNDRISPSERQQAKEASEVYRGWVDSHRLTPKR